MSAEEKAGGKSKKITITNDKGRLSKEEIEQVDHPVITHHLNLILITQFNHALA